MTATLSVHAKTRHYPAQPVIVAMARDQVITTLRRWHLPVSLDDAELTISELATNAVRTSRPTDRISIHLRQKGLGLLIGVWDASASMPTVATIGDLTLEDIVPDPQALEHENDRTGGWGLPLVHAIAGALQVERTFSPKGKWVIALLPAISIGMEGDRHGAA
ncbi:ATP-binding protein [Actinomadura sp.]|uniref:ATP-binding protein n=1 Tax=Actinomadura sp. TaxID=1989 RepID=UPI0037C91A56